MEERERLSEQECEAAIDRLFPNGFAGPDVLAEIVPEGWAASPFLRLFHPTAEQVFEETLAMHRNIDSFLRKKLGESAEKPPTLEAVRSELKQDPVEPEKELGELIALCLWDIFSENHDVIASDGRCVDLGSWRGSAGLLADLLNRQVRSMRYDYMDFYMGTIRISCRADLRPVYAMVFRRLKAQGYDWEYSFPRIQLIDLSSLSENQDRPDWQDYSPTAALAREAEERAKEEKNDQVRKDLEESHRRAVEEAKHRPPPATVEAYWSVFGRFPAGWPPWEEDPSGEDRE